MKNIKKALLIVKSARSNIQNESSTDRRLLTTAVNINRQKNGRIAPHPLLTKNNYQLLPVIRIGFDVPEMPI